MTACLAVSNTALCSLHAVLLSLTVALRSLALSSIDTVCVGPCSFA